MTESTDSARNANESSPQPADDAKEFGRYTEGDYGATGIVSAEESGDKEGKYSQGDYGTAGSESADQPSVDEHAVEGDTYVTTDEPSTSNDTEVPGQYTDSELD